MLSSNPEPLPSWDSRPVAALNAPDAALILSCENWLCPGLRRMYLGWWDKDLRKSTNMTSKLRGLKVCGGSFGVRGLNLKFLRGRRETGKETSELRSLSSKTEFGAETSESGECELTTLGWEPRRSRLGEGRMDARENIKEPPSSELRGDT